MQNLSHRRRIRRCRRRLPRACRRAGRGRKNRRRAGHGRVFLRPAVWCGSAVLCAKAPQGQNTRRKAAAQQRGAHLRRQQQPARPRVPQHQRAHAAHNKAGAGADGANQQQRGHRLRAAGKAAQKPAQQRGRRPFAAQPQQPGIGAQQQAEPSRRRAFQQQTGNHHKRKQRRDHRFVTQPQPAQNTACGNSRAQYHACSGEQQRKRSQPLRRGAPSPQKIHKTSPLLDIYD